MGFSLNPNLMVEMNARHKNLLAAAAAEASEALRDELSSETHGTGIHWPTLPNRSSAPGEMPVKQSGALAEGVGIADDTSSATGVKVVIDDDLEKLVDLEFAPPSVNPNDPPFGTRESGGRAPMWTHMTSAETIQLMNDAMERLP